MRKTLIALSATLIAGTILIPTEQSLACGGGGYWFAQRHVRVYNQQRSSERRYRLAEAREKETETVAPRKQQTAAETPAPEAAQTPPAPTAELAPFDPVPAAPAPIKIASSDHPAQVIVKQASPAKGSGDCKRFLPSAGVVVSVPCSGE